MSKGRVLVGMSGGVDSSVAAWLLKEQGYEVTGCTMRLYDYTGIGLKEQNSCCGIKDVDDARAVAERIGVGYLALNLMESFREEVMDHFVQEYLDGHTPNPCIDCNRRLKFGRLLSWAKEHGFDYLATGHYVRKCFLDGRWYLKKATDLSRDQSYVLYPVTQETLSGLLFPLGDLKKTEDVRRIAEEQGFVNARKHDSQDICFVPDGDYASFIGRMVSMEADRFCPGKEQPACLSPGSIIDRSGRVLGRHRGAVHYTIGQRRGLGLAVPESVYVLSKDMQANTVTVGPNEALFSRELTVKDLFWQRPAPEEGEVFRARVRIRYQHREQEASVTVLPGALVRVLFDEGQRAVCPGQAAVFYDGDLVLGGGTIL